MFSIYSRMQESISSKTRPFDEWLKFQDVDFTSLDIASDPPSPDRPGLLGCTGWCAGPILYHVSV